MRILLFTGKGGVGKTTIAAATGIKTAQLGYKTLVMSTDPAHSLSDSFQRKLNPYPTEIMKNLHAMEVNVEFELERHWSSIKKYLEIFFKSQGIEDVIAEELAIFPGFDEFASLLNLLKFYRSGEYDVIILDCAPTGETLRLLSVPEVAKWYMRRFFGIERKILKIVKPVAEPLINVPLPPDDVLDKIRELYVELSNLKEIFESDFSSVRIVMNPEKIVIRESERAFTYLNLFGYNVDCVIVNKILPKGFLAEWRELQEKYLKEIEERFPVPIFKVEFKFTEIVGDMLFELADEIYGDRDPTEIFYRDKPIKILKEDSTTTMIVKTPFVSKEDLKLFKRGDELIIIAGQWKRIVTLPQSLALKEISGAKFNNGELKIIFEG
uniref:Putative arsenical pump-driving ATPase n=1 Tax=Geoglobus ahangari TaxID=113653 RepID=A0A7C3YNY0_9EURY